MKNSWSARRASGSLPDEHPVGAALERDLGVDRRGVDGHQRQGAREEGLEDVTQAPVIEARHDGKVGVGGEGRELPDDGGEREVHFFRVHRLGVEEMRQHRNRSAQGVQEPEAARVGVVKLDARRAPLLAARSELALPRDHRAEHATQPARHEGRRRDVEHRRHERVAHDRAPVGLPDKLRHGKRHHALAPLGAEDDAKVGDRELELLGPAARVRVVQAARDASEAVLRRRLAIGDHVRAALVGDADMHVERRVFSAHVGLERTRLRERIARGSPALDDDAVGPHRDEAPEAELARLQKAVVDLERGDPPAEATERRQPLAKEIFVVSILGLEVVLTDQQSFRPDWPTPHRR